MIIVLKHALNMMDEMRGNGGSVRINKLESMLGIPVVPISAAKNEGITELINHAIHVALIHGVSQFFGVTPHGYAVGELAGMFRQVFRHLPDGHSAFQFHIIRV